MERITLTPTINGYLLAWRKAILTNDLNKVLSLYAPNAILLGTIANSYEVKRENIKSYFVDFFGKNTITDVKYLSVVNQFITGSPNLIISSGVYVFERKNDEPVKARFSFVFEASTPNSEPKSYIVNHHSSIPAE